MNDLQQSKNLAHAIGLYHIALVVNAVYHQMKTHAAFAKHFDVSLSDDDQTAHLLYFWWVVLGGKELSHVDWDVIRRDPRMRISPSLLRYWLALFRRTATPIIGAEFTAAWMREAEQLCSKFPASGDDGRGLKGATSANMGEIQER